MLNTKQFQLLELFAGSRSIGSVADSIGMKTFSVDWKNYKGIDFVIDIENLSIDHISFVPDIVWASPDCTTYSIAAVSTHRNGIHPKSEYAKKCDRVNQHFLDLIKEFLIINPALVFFIENPRGILRKMPFMQKFRRETVWYCQYGDERAKPTDIWTNSQTWKPRKQCFNKNRHCTHQPAPRGSQTGTQGLKTFERSRIPSELCLEVLRSVIEPSNHKKPIFSYQAQLFKEELF